MNALGDGRHSNPGAKERTLLDEAGEAELLRALQGPPLAFGRRRDVERDEGGTLDS